MKISVLNEQEKAATGFTHKAIIAYNPVAALNDFTAAATTQTYTLATLASGSYIGNAALKLVADLSGGSVSAAVALVGKTGTTNAYCTSTNVFTGSTVFYKAGDGASFNQAGGEIFITSSALIVTVTTTTANVSTLTSGELHVYYKLVDMSQY